MVFFECWLGSAKRKDTVNKTDKNPLASFSYHNSTAIQATVEEIPFQLLDKCAQFTPNKDYFIYSHCYQLNNSRRILNTLNHYYRFIC